MYSASADDFAALARSGFTTVGPWYLPIPDRELLDAAARAGLGVIFPIGDPRGRANAVFTQSEAQIHTSIGSRVREMADHPAVVAWYLLPEEVRTWEPAELAYLSAATEAIRAADPQRRPILSYQPNHYDAAALTPVLAHLDVATKGMYANYVGQRDSRAWVRWSVDQLEAASDGPAWVVPEMFQDPADADAATISAWARHDVFAGLVAGARGVLVYSGFRRKGFTRYDDYSAAYRAIAGELNGPLGLGDVLLRGTVCPAESTAMTHGFESVTFDVGGTTHRVPALARLETAYAGARWLWLVSSSPTPVVVSIPGWSRASLVSRSAGVVHDAEQLRLPPWAVVVLRRPRGFEEKVQRRSGT
ncbi:MAG: hypothetical protein IAG13_28690 [Deltaproteobacteria bacterium]|nr:hypothetical protein [Nannocystaceae bacterium]